MKSASDMSAKALESGAREEEIDGPDEWENVGGKCRFCGADDCLTLKVVPDAEMDGEGREYWYHCSNCERTW